LLQGAGGILKSPKIRPRGGDGVQYSGVTACLVMTPVAKWGADTIRACAAGCPRGGMGGRHASRVASLR